MLKRLLMTMAGIAFLATAAPRAQAESALDFQLVNATGYGISAIYIAPSSSKNWGANILEEGLGDGESASVTFQPAAAHIGKWDLRVSWEDEEDPDVYWTGYDLSKISKITLKYDHASNKTSAIVE